MVKRWIVGATVAALLSGCAGDLIRSKVENGIENSLPEYIGPALKYSVKVSGPSEPMLRGKIKHLHIEGDEVQIAPSLTVDHLIVDMDDVEADVAKKQIRRVRQTIFEAHISEDSVNRYMVTTRAASKDLRVSFGKGTVTVTVYPSFLGIDTEFRITGRPEIVQGSKVRFIADRAMLAKIPVPSFLVNKVLDHVNPVLDLSEMKFPVVLSGMTVKEGAIVIKGRANFTSSG